MADITIRNKATGKEYTGPEGQPIPDGYEVVPGGDDALTSLKNAVIGAPRKMMDDVASAVDAVASAVVPREGQTIPGRLAETLSQVTKPSTSLPLVLPGGGSVVTRLGSSAAGRMLEDAADPTKPAPTFRGNLVHAAKGIVGDVPALVQNPSWETARGVALSPGAMELLVPAIGLGARISPGGKARINEGQSQELLGQIRNNNRVAGEAIDAAPVSPLQREPRTAAAIKRGFESGAVADASSQRFNAVLNRVANAAGNPAVNGPALQEAYAMMPQLEQRYLGAVGPGGFSLQQAQQIRAWVGDPAFARSTLGQGVRAVPQQRLWGEITQEMEGAIAHAPRALQLWQANNRAYSSTMAMQDAMTQGHAFQGQPNRTFLNRSELSEYFARNELDLVRRLGRERYDAFVNQVLGGGQPGTRDLLAPGSGAMASPILSWLRGTNTGAMQAARLPLATAAPNIGSQYTGRLPYTLPPELQAILDVAMRQMGRNE